MFTQMTMATFQMKPFLTPYKTQSKELKVNHYNSFRDTGFFQSHTSDIITRHASRNDDSIFGEEIIEMPSYVPLYVMLPLGVIDIHGKIVDIQNLTNDLATLKFARVDGVMIDCWWGIVEAETPQIYNWTAYKEIFKIVREQNLKLQVVMSFHECGGNVGDDVYIPLPLWVKQIGENNPDIYFTDREGRRNTECLSWGVDEERVLGDRTAIEVYYDYMIDFRKEFNEFFVDGTISEIQVGLGPCGELRYPSYTAKHGWTYPGVGEFQCYDRYLMRNLSTAAKAIGEPDWAKGPEDAGSYCSSPQETRFFCDLGNYRNVYGQFFLEWYAQLLIDHGDRVLSAARSIFEDCRISAKLSGIHWLYKTQSHAAELTAGFYTPGGRHGYTPIAKMLRKHGAILNFTCLELRTADQNCPYAFSDPEELVWDVLLAAWSAGISCAGENALPCYERDGYEKIIQNGKSRPGTPGIPRRGWGLSAFTYLRLSPTLLEPHNFVEFERFVRRMHGIIPSTGD